MESLRDDLFVAKESKKKTQVPSGRPINNINKEIKRQLGLDIKLWKGDGYFYFYSEDDKLGNMIAGFETASVYVFHLTSYTVDQWVDQLREMIKKWEDDKPPVSDSNKIGALKITKRVF